MTSPTPNSLQEWLNTTHCRICLREPLPKHWYFAPWCDDCLDTWLELVEKPDYHGDINQFAKERRDAPQR